MVLLLIISALTLGSTRASASPSEILKGDNPQILDTDRWTLRVLGPDVIISLVVEQRFFNQAGNEQRGLRVTTALAIELNGVYRVPGAGSGYADIACSEVGVDADDDRLNEGPGENFIAVRTGSHVACYRQIPGSPRGPSPGPPGADEPEVLGVIIEQGSDEARDDESLDGDGALVGDDGRTASVLGKVLARTGSSIVPIGLAGVLLLLVGGRLLWRGSTPPSSDR